jgi:hypothetical protein
VNAIAAMRDPVIRNLQITQAYFRISQAMAARTGECANWCTFATWASRQAGRTVRGEDLLETLQRFARQPAGWLHPVQAAWRALLRAGLFHSETRLGSLVQAIHSPFDAFERASDSVARGNLNVFAEIGAEFARYLATCTPDAPPDSAVVAAFLEGLRPGDPPEGQQLLREAFLCYQQQGFEPDPARRAQLILLANGLTGLHEQTRLQPEIREAMEAGPRTAADLKRRAAQRLFPGWQQWLRKPAVSLVAALYGPFSRLTADLTCRIITEHLMVITLPGPVTLSLGRHLPATIPPDFEVIHSPALQALLDRFHPCRKTVGSLGRVDCTTEDWSNLEQRMHFIFHLFRSYHYELSPLTPPFSAEQVQAIAAGRLPAGDL